MTAPPNWNSASRVQRQRGTPNGDGKRQARGPAGRPGATGTGRGGNSDYTPARRLLAADRRRACATCAKTIELTYQGLVRRAAAEDWTDIDLTLSTARPAPATFPRLNPWIVDIDAPNAYYGAEGNAGRSGPMPQSRAIARTSANGYTGLGAEALRRGSPPREVSSGASASFHIPVPATLNSDGSAREGHHRPPGNAGQAALPGSPALRETATWRRKPATTATAAAPRHPEYLSRQQLRRQRPSARGVMPGKASNWHWAPTRASASNASWSSATRQQRPDRQPHAGQLRIPHRRATTTRTPNACSSRTSCRSRATSRSRSPAGTQGAGNQARGVTTS